MPKVRAVKDLFHGGQRRRKGDVFEATDGQVAEARKRFKERQIRPAFELVPDPKPAVKAADNKAPDTSDVA